MEAESRRKGPRSPSADSDDSSHRRRSRKYDRSPSPRRSRYRRSRSRDRRSRSSSRDRRRKESRSQEWKTPAANPAQNPSVTAPAAPYVPTPVHNQYQAPPPPNTSQPPPPIAAYNSGYGYNYNYGSSYDYSYQPPAGYRSDYPPPNWQGGQVAYTNQQAPPPPTLASTQESSRPVETSSSNISRPEDAKKEAIAAEVKQQKATLGKQREEYVKKSTTLQRELEILRQQCDEISKEGGRDNNRIIKENQKLQVEIQNKMKSIHNVIDMLTGIIGDKATVDDLKNKFKLDLNKKVRSPKEDFPKGKSASPDRSSGSDSEKEVKPERDRRSPEGAKPLYNFVHYDPEMHWCKVCDIFPKTAKEYLNHLHSNEHKEACLENKIVDMPWHERNGEGTEKEIPYYPGLPRKRTPIKGLQFFIPATAWYCKLCDAWIGDLHCASLHLKSKRHSENFSRYVEQNPSWETDWMADREKAFSEEKHKQIQLELQKQKDDEPPPKSKKSKKSKKNKKKSKKRRNRSSASDTSSDSENTESDSDHDMSKSIRVAMRNKMKASTQAILNEEIDYHGLKMKGHWNKSAPPNQPPSDHLPEESEERQLLNSIRNKIKEKQEEEMKSMVRRKELENVEMVAGHEQNNFNQKPEGLEAWGPKEPPKPFWIKKEEEKPQTMPNKPIELPKPEEMPKPHMGFWTKQQVNMSVKPPENKDKDDDRDGSDRYKDDRDRKYDRREDKYDRYSSRYDRRRGRDHRDRDRDRDRDYYDDRRKRDSNDSPRRDRSWRDSPKRGYDKYKDRRDDSSNDESKFEKKTNESAKGKKGGMSSKKSSSQQQGKGKLPFIGRLPLFKKKVEDPKLPEKDIAPLPYQQSKFEDTPRVPNEIINPPGVVHITKLATPVVLNNAAITTSKTTPMKILVAPPPPVLNDAKPAQTLQVVDMEIEDQSEETVIEESVVEQQDQSSPSKVTVPSHPPPSLTQQVESTAYSNTNLTSAQFTTSRPPPFITNPPPFVPARFPVRPPMCRPPFVANPYVTNHQAVQHPAMTIPPGTSLDATALIAPDGTEITEATNEKRTDPSVPLPDDLQEALNIIFPKDESEMKQQAQQEANIMYSSMYSMLGCVGYGPEYMDQPPPEITNTETEADTQLSPCDLEMLGIDEGDTIL
ncbi:zinc finger matrin-type protein CG9776-like [Prorops nasuta]|uniref:zinc finger matrin-type protein CG9776-like n=1 Tax=Prorops nasuta TaxID=863751 RepID=UPI0034CF2C4F